MIVIEPDPPPCSPPLTNGRSIPPALAQRILVLGKSVAFMRRCCKDREW